MRLRLEIGRKFVSRQKTKRPKAEPLADDERFRDYFFGVHVAQVAHVVLPSSQHFMPQADFFSAEPLPQQAQPVMRVAAQTSAAQRARSFAVFIRDSIFA